MAGFVRQSVSYSQYQIWSAAGDPWLEIYTVGDDLLHTGGPAGCTGFTGIHTGDIEIQVLGYGSEPPMADDDSWDSATETTLWCPGGRLTVAGLIDGGCDELAGIPVPGEGLIRVRVHARNRIHDSVREDTDPPEQHEVHVWPVTEETGPRSLWADGSRDEWSPRPDVAAAWAMQRLLEEPGGIDHGDRVTVVRSRTVSWPVARALPERLAGTVPAGDLEIRLHPGSATAAGETVDAVLTWEWAVSERPIFPRPATTVPDEVVSTVRLHAGPDPDAGLAEVTVRHEGVPGRQAVLLGLIWDHLLDGMTGSGRWAPERYSWEVTLRKKAAEATRMAERAQRRQDERAAAAWGGTVPGERLRRAGYRAKQLAKLDRPLLDQLAALPAAGRWQAACWGVRRALESAGLDRIGWIAEALATVETGRPLPASLRDGHGRASLDRILADPGLPQTMIRIPGYDQDVLRTAVAIPALLSLTAEDPPAPESQPAGAGTRFDPDDLLGVVAQAVYLAACSFGPGTARFLDDCRAAFPAR